MIRLDNIHKAFGSKQVLTGFTLEVREGDIAVILGYSGTGKSVAIKHIVGLLEPMAEASRLAHAAGALFVAVIEPVSLSVLEAPGAYGADIAARTSNFNR